MMKVGKNIFDPLRFLIGFLSFFVFNVGSGKATSIKDLVETVLELTGAEGGFSCKSLRVDDIRDSLGYFQD